MSGSGYDGHNSEFSNLFAKVLKKRMEKMNVGRELRIELMPAEVVRWSSRPYETLMDLIVNDGAPLRIFSEDGDMFRV
jgi:hypothetical protein